MKVTKDRLVDIIEKANDGEIRLVTSSPLKMNKGGRGGVKPNPYTGCDVRKNVACRYMLTEKTYEDQVNEALVSEGAAGEFETKGLPWGKWKVPGKVIEHNGEFYLRCYVNGAERPEVTYEMDGEILSEQGEELKTIREYLPKAAEHGSKTQEEAGLNEDKQVKPKNVSFSNIREIEIGSVTYQIDGNGQN